MPEYEYLCGTCHHIQPWHSAVEDLRDCLACPACGGLMNRNPQLYRTVRIAPPPSRQPQEPKPLAPHQCHSGCALHHWRDSPLDSPTSPQRPL